MIVGKAMILEMFNDMAIVVCWTETYYDTGVVRQLTDIKAVNYEK